MTHYRQLAREERYLISQLLQLGHSQRAIAAQLGRAPSTVSRELKRNATTHDGAYRHCKADRYAQARRRRCRRGPKFTPQEYATVRRYLRKKWSPKQIVGVLRPQGLLDMSHESIYRYVLRDKKAGEPAHEASAWCARCAAAAAFDVNRAITPPFAYGVSHALTRYSI